MLAKAWDRGLNGTACRGGVSLLPWAPGARWRKFVRAFPSFVLGCAVALLSGCGQHGAVTPNAGGGALLSSVAKRAPGGSVNLPTHVVVIVQENRSVDNLFQQLPGADTQSYGYDRNGNRIPLQQIPLAQTWDPSHAHSAFVSEFAYGKLNGFNREKCGGCPSNAAYSYVNPSDVSQYYAMAEQYAFADHNMQSNEGPSQPAHLYLIAAQSGTPGSTWYISENPKKPKKSDAADCLAPTGVSVM